MSILHPKEFLILVHNIFSFLWITLATVSWQFFVTYQHCYGHVRLD